MSFWDVNRRKEYDLTVRALWRLQRELSEKYGLDIDPDVKVEDTTVGIEQRVEILKTLYRGADVVILDEPTAVLTPQSTRVISNRTVSDGKRENHSFISHKLQKCFLSPTILR